MAQLQVIEHTIPCQHIREYPHATVSDHETVLQLAVKEYVPLNKNSEVPDKGITIITGHSNGFPKELYEPLWSTLAAFCEEKGFCIRRILAADRSHQGISGVINEHELGDDPSWFDHSRDLLHMINHFRPQRPIMGIAHSMGAVELAHLSHLHPRLFSSLVLIEPIIVRGPYAGPNVALPSTFRRDTWLSKDEAATAFMKNPLFRTWDSRVLDRYIEYGLRELPTALYPSPSVSQDADHAPGNVTERKGGEVTLTTTKHQEAWHFTRSVFIPPSPTSQTPNAFPSEDATIAQKIAPDRDQPTESTLLFYRAEPAIVSRLLPFLRPRTLFIYGTKSPLSPPPLQAEHLKLAGTGYGGNGGAASGMVEKLVLETQGHWAPFVDVEKCATELAGWLDARYRDASEDREFWTMWDSGKSQKGRKEVSERWKEGVRLSSMAKRGEGRGSKL